MKRKNPPMAKQLVLKRLNATLKNLKELPNSNFNYGDFVKRKKTIDGVTCGTVCCVAGWYPKWFPKSGLTWDQFGLSAPEGADVSDMLMKHHGISNDLVSVLFYGQKEIFNSQKNDLINIEIGIGDTYRVKKDEVVKLFETVIDLIKKDIIQYF